MIDCTFFHGFPYTDIPQVGASVVVTTNGDPDLARRVAAEIATSVWEARDQFQTESLTPEIALRQAVAAVRTGGGPVVVNETSDNPGGGTPGDATHVLRAMLDLGLADELDAGRVRLHLRPRRGRPGPRRRRIGAVIDVRLGAKHDDLHGTPIEGPVYVKTLTDGEFVFTSPMTAGRRARWGATARLQIGGPGGLDVIVTSVRSQVFDREVFQLCGIDVTRCDLVVLKSSQHFRAGFGDLATMIITADSPGLTTLDVTVFTHDRADGAPLAPRPRHRL